MKSRLFQATLAVLGMFSAISAPSAMADSIIKVQRPIDIHPNIQLLPITSISGVITNGGSNNGGQPNFTCNEIQVHVAEDITPKPSGNGITVPQYKQIGSSVQATGNIATGCKYTLPIPSQATNKFVYVFASSPRKWTTFVNAVDVSPANFSNPIKVQKNEKLTNLNLRIYATAIK